MTTPDHRPEPRTTGSVLRWFVVATVLAGSGCLFFRNDITARLFGPPRVILKEAHEKKADDLTFDHGVWDKLLNEHVDALDRVDYTALLREEVQLNAYLDSLAAASFDPLGRDEKLAMLINAYNAFTVRLILDHWDHGRLTSIKDIPAKQRWDAKRWTFAGRKYSLSQIENELIRPKFIEPRIHFALVCAAIGCPKLRSEAFTGEQLESQLADQTVAIHTHSRWYQFDATNQIVHLTPLYQWYGDDFKQVAGSVLNFIALHDSKLKSAIESGDEPRIKWLPYDWNLNHQRGDTDDP